MSFLTCNILMIHSLVGKTIMLRNNPQSVLNFSMTKMSGASDSSVECRLACSLHLPVAVVPEDQTVDKTILVLASSPCLKRIPPFRGGGGGRSSSSSSEGEIFSLSLFSFFCRGGSSSSVGRRGRSSLSCLSAGESPSSPSPDESEGGGWGGGLSPSLRRLLGAASSSSGKGKSALVSQIASAISSFSTAQSPEVNFTRLLDSFKLSPSFS